MLGTAAPVQMDMSGTAGAATGKLLPTGSVVDVIETSRGPIEASIVDCANPWIFVRAESVGMKGTGEPGGDRRRRGPAQVPGGDPRHRPASSAAWPRTWRTPPRTAPPSPMVAFVTEAQDYYYPPEKKTIKKEEVDLVSRLMFMQVLHKTYAGTARLHRRGRQDQGHSGQSGSASDDPRAGPHRPSRRCVIPCYPRWMRATLKRPPSSAPPAA